MYEKETLLMLYNRFTWLIYHLLLEERVQAYQYQACSSLNF